MSSVTEEDGMAKRASQAGDARTTDRTTARRLGTELSACGKRRRWTAEQKHKIGFCRKFCHWTIGMYEVSLAYSASE